ncbi:MAG TPA: Rieske 2Fe-2S domain-containing protein [Acidimicrobiales bacterium]|jgi:nitrite reductase (NADH) small subunit/3-phenylpropionate/trans-cinnamate dioxygenase ferredoxin subunit|nr:Rieske 2Fe-2S domain-containing protein [Acidimicrobiales bacterium]
MPRDITSVPVHVVARVEDLRDWRGRVVRAGDRELAVFRQGDDVYALDNVCIHNGGPLGEADVEDGCAVCPWHGWRYRLVDGRSPLNPDVGVRTYRAWIDERGDVLVDVPT